MKYDYLVVGTGLFGAVFAYEMKRAGKTCFCIDKRDNIGGNIYTQEENGIQVHKYGAHIFHTSNRKVWDYVNQFAEFNNYINSPVAVYKDELYNLPFNMNTFSKMWGVRTPAEAKAIIAEQQGEFIGTPTNLEEHVIQLVGKDIYEKLVKGYTEKQWGRSCKDLPPSVMKRIPVRYTYDNNYFNDPYQGIPIKSYTEIINSMLEGCDIKLGIDYNQHAEELNKLANKVIYTGTIDSFYNYCYGALEYRSLRFETEILDEENYQGVAVVNYTDRETPYTRIIEHKHFVFGKQPKTVISREYPLEWNLGIEPYYPINDEKNQEKYEMYHKLAKKEKNILFGGRLGEYRYYDMQDTIASALNMVKKELN